jgi:asparagine synthase (glutamine-hydrolysing)
LPISLQQTIHVAYSRRAIRRVWNELVPSWLATNLAEDLRRRHLQAVVDAERARKFASPTRETEYRLLYPPVTVPSRAPWSIQSAQPYADRRLHEFLLSIPPTQKFDPDILPGKEFYGRSKLIVRHAMRGIVPDAIRTRVTKTVFAWEVENDFARQWNTYEFLFGPSAHPEVASRGYVSQPAFWGRLQRLRDGASAVDSMLVSRIVALEVWLQGLRRNRREWLRVREPSCLSYSIPHH